MHLESSKIHHRIARSLNNNVFNITKTIDQNVKTDSQSHGVKPVANLMKSHVYTSVAYADTALY
jgi:hypothetical protein